MAESDGPLPLARNLRSVKELISKPDQEKDAILAAVSDSIRTVNAR